MKHQQPLKKQHLYTTGEVAARFAVSRVAVKKWIKRGKLVALRTPGGHFRVLGEQLERYDHPPAEAPRILVVDDEDVVLDVIADGLRTFWPDAKLETASDGYEGLIKLGAFRPNLAVIDIRMPVLDGFEVCRRVKSNPFTRDTKILAISAHDLPTVGARALKAGADRFLAKPFSISALVDIARELLGAAGPRDA